MVWAYPQTIPYPQLVTFGKAISAPSKTHLLFIYYLFICSFFKFLLSRGWVLVTINDISIPMDTPLLNRHRFDIKIPHRKPVNISRIVKSLSKSNWWYWLDVDNSTFVWLLWSMIYPWVLQVAYLILFLCRIDITYKHVKSCLCFNNISCSRYLSQAKSKL